ncbi:MAG TPA: copper resistance protein CopC [Streptosporangiaceae bacterium]
MARRFAYLVAGIILAAIGMVAGAPAALAHATVVSTSPADGAIVARAPSRVSVTFDEPVGITAGSLEVFAPDGSRVDTGGAAHSTPEGIRVALRPGLVHGTYTVGWHVISADSHPVHGAFTFSIGAPSSTTVNPAALGPGVSRLAGVLLGVVRWIAFVCFAILAGAISFVIWCWPAGASRPAVLRLAMGAWAGLAVSVLAAVLLQGAYGTGQGASHVFLPEVLHATLYSRYGRALGVRLLLVIAALFVFSVTLGSLRADDRRARNAAGAVWGVLTAALAATWSVAGHAGTGSQVPVALAADTVHLSAVAIWLGGLVMLSLIVLRRARPSGSRPARGRAGHRDQAATAQAAQAVTRFSPIALGCVVAIVATGTYQSWRDVGAVGGLTGTIYGRLLLVKIAAMCALIGLGYLARRRIAQGLLMVPAAESPATAREIDTQRRIRAGVGGRLGSAGKDARPARTAGIGLRPGYPRPGDDGAGALPDYDLAAVSLARLRWSVAAEVVIAASVLAVTAVLVNTPTARETFTSPVSATAAFSTGGPGGRGTVSVTVTPAGPGSNYVTMSITGNAGRPFRPRQIQAALSLPGRHLGPLPVLLRRTGPGHYRSGPVPVAIAGAWQLQITIRSDAFDETTIYIPVPVR